MESLFVFSIVALFIFVLVLAIKVMKKWNFDIDASEKEFENVYNNLLTNYRVNFEPIWKKRRLKYIVIDIVVVSMCVLCGIWLEDLVMALYMSIIAFAILFIIRIRSRDMGSKIIQNKINRLYKETVIEFLAKSINFTLEYRYENRNYLKEEYSKVNFEDGILRKRVADDYFIGNIENVGFCFGEIIVRLSNSILSNKNRQPAYAVLFAKINNHNYKGEEIRIINRKRLEAGSVNLFVEDINNMYSIPDNLRENVLAQKIKDVLVRFYQKDGRLADVIVNGEGIYVRIHLRSYYRGLLFEPIWNPIDKKKIFNYYAAIKMTNDLAREIKNLL